MVDISIVQINDYLKKLNKIFADLPKNRKVVKTKSSDISSEIFDNTVKSSLSIKEYIERIVVNSELSSGAFFDSLRLLKKFLLKYKHKNFSLENSHKLIFISILTAIKLNDDTIYPDHLYALIGGVKTSNIVTLEYVFFETIEYSFLS